jgi:hypothetical protein
MTLIIALNAVLSFGVIVMVVAPLIWAILTQQRDAQPVAPRRQSRAGLRPTRPAFA